jgi:hypothetical protein
MIPSSDPSARHLGYPRTRIARAYVHSAATPPGPGLDASAGPAPSGLDFDPTLPNVARVYDCLLGGKDNFAADRRAAAKLLAAVPGAAVAARENRAFLSRAVRFLAEEAGVRQFLDIGAGLPSAGAVHELVQGVVPQARVVYADSDPVVLRHAEALIGQELGTGAVRADLRQPRALLAQPTLQRLIDLGEPVAVLLVAVLHFVEDREDPWAIVDCLKDQIAPGSYLVISHVTADHISPVAAVRAREVYAEASAPGVTRSQAEIARFFSGLEMVAPGLVDVSSWRPAYLGPAADDPVLFYAGIGCKSGPGRPR